MEALVVAQFTDKDKIDKEYTCYALVKNLMCFDTIEHCSQKTYHPSIIKCTMKSYVLVNAFIVLFFLNK